jgi:hypothetical protein
VIAVCSLPCFKKGQQFVVAKIRNTAWEVVKKSHVKSQLREKITSKNLTTGRHTKKGGGQPDHLFSEIVNYNLRILLKYLH